MRAPVLHGRYGVKPQRYSARRHFAGHVIGLVLGIAVFLAIIVASPFGR